jgi:hypothetical protein
MELLRAASTCVSPSADSNVCSGSAVVIVAAFGRDLVTVKSAALRMTAGAHRAKGLLKRNGECKRGGNFWMLTIRPVPCGTNAGRRRRGPVRADAGDHRSGDG